MADDLARRVRAMTEAALASFPWPVAFRDWTGAPLVARAGTPRTGAAARSR